jgi:hypothetical protein
MPRKKASEVQTGASLPARISCPACKSEVSSDGATLHARSGYLDDLIETDAGVEKLEKAVADLEGKLSVSRAEVAKVKQEAQSKTEEKNNAGTVGKVGDESKRGGWW